LDEQVLATTDEALAKAMARTTKKRISINEETVNDLFARESGQLRKSVFWISLLHSRFWSE